MAEIMAQGWGPYGLVTLDTRRTPPKASLAAGISVAFFGIGQQLSVIRAAAIDSGAPKRPRKNNHHREQFQATQQHGQGANPGLKVG